MADRVKMILPRLMRVHQVRSVHCGSSLSDHASSTLATLHRLDVRALRLLVDRESDMIVSFL